MLLSTLHEINNTLGINLNSIVILDTETTIKNKSVGTSKANPHCPDNYIVRYGLAFIDSHVEIGAGTIPRTRNTLVVGHNVKFDALYVLKEDPNFLDTNLLWDTMEVEYLITGQQTKLASLDKLAVKYGLPIKDSKIKEYWDSGVDTEDIPDSELIPYLTQDVTNTKSIFLLQLAKINSMRGMLPLVIHSMAAVNLTTDIERNGVYIDTDKFLELASETHFILSEIEKTLSVDTYSSVDYNSNKELSTFLWGGTVSRDAVEVVQDSDGNPVVYKSGKKKGEIKTRKITKKVTILPKITEDIISKNNIRKYVGIVDEEALSALASCVEDIDLRTYINNVLTYRKLYKDFNTYFLGVGKLIWPHDSCLHGQWLHTVTSTGRLSSREPNMQNFPAHNEV